jgi:hypothetical protein
MPWKCDNLFPRIILKKNTQKALETRIDTRTKELEQNDISHLKTSDIKKLVQDIEMYLTTNYTTESAQRAERAIIAILRKSRKTDITWTAIVKLAEGTSTENLDVDVPRAYSKSLNNVLLALISTHDGRDFFTYHVIGLLETILKKRIKEFGSAEFVRQLTPFMCATNVQQWWWTRDYGIWLTSPKVSRDTKSALRDVMNTYDRRQEAERREAERRREEEEKVDDDFGSDYWHWWSKWRTRNNSNNTSTSNNERANLLQKYGLSTSADETKIKSTYKKLALENHPDRNPGDPEAINKMATINSDFEKLLPKR